MTYSRSKYFKVKILRDGKKDFFKKILDMNWVVAALTEQKTTPIVYPKLLEIGLTIIRDAGI